MPSTLCAEARSPLFFCGVRSRRASLKLVLGFLLLLSAPHRAGKMAGMQCVLHTQALGLCWRCFYSLSHLLNPEFLLFDCLTFEAGSVAQASLELCPTFQMLGSTHVGGYYLLKCSLSRVYMLNFCPAPSPLRILFRSVSQTLLSLSWTCRSICAYFKNFTAPGVLLDLYQIIPLTLALCS